MGRSYRETFDVMLDHVLKHLDALVSFDTRNPPRALGNIGIFEYIRGSCRSPLRDGGPR